MRIYSAGFQPDVARRTYRVSGFVSTVPTVVIAVWLVAGGGSVASGHVTTQPPGALAAQPYSAVTQVFPAAVIARQPKVAAIDEEDDGDDDRADPDDSNDTLAAADGFWWGADDANLRASQTEREKPRLAAFANRVAQAS
jgi:hypothetical protein